jgi:1-acyl-sn-glycerol-3-phosphate acyltransferase
MLAYWFLWIVVRLLARVLFRLEIAGQEHLPKTGGVIIAANHASYLDIPILGCGMPRQSWFIGRMDLFPGPIGAVMRFLGWIPMRRERVDRKGFDEAIRHLRAGHPVVIYPEGGRTEDGQLQPGKPGVGLLVAATGCAVVPARLDGTYEALPPGARWIRRRPIRVTFGAPMTFSALLEDAGNDGESTKKMIYQQIGQKIMDRIAELGQGQMSSPHSLRGARCS